MANQKDINLLKNLQRQRCQKNVKGGQLVDNKCSITFGHDTASFDIENYETEDVEKKKKMLKQQLKP